jgi:glycerate 2-kinase
VRAVHGFDLEARVGEALPPRPPSRARVRVLAVGKAAPAMARGVLRVWSSRVERVLLVAPDGTKVDEGDARVDVVRAGHPLPDARSVDAAARALELARGQAKDLLLVLVSGGASALLCAPGEGVSLDDKIAVTEELLTSGAPIAAFNVVRRHLSRLKGGGLTRAAFPGRVLALVASDVIDGEIYDVGSGPTTPDPTTRQDAEVALARWGPSFARRLSFGETLKADELPARRQRARIVASPTDLAAAVGHALEARGFSCSILRSSNASTETLAREYASLLTEIAPGKAVVRAAEPALAVTHTAPGRGGRCTHLAALVGRDLPEGVVFLAGASDGVDGSSGFGGAVVDSSFRLLGLGRIDRALSRFDSASLHAEAGTGIVLEPSGQNFADVHVLCRGPSARAG